MREPSTTFLNESTSIGGGWWTVRWDDGCDIEDGDTNPDGVLIDGGTVADVDGRGGFEGRVCGAAGEVTAVCC